jgi:glycosyltransferase involved in cell wall biosynthesis
MPKLLMACSTVVDGSGMMAAVAPLASQLARRGFDVRLVGPIGPSERPIADGQAHGVQIDVLRRQPFSPPSLADAWNAASRVVGFARDGERAVVHVHGVWTAANAAACLRSRTLGIPYVVSPHGMLLPAAMHRSRLKKRCALGTFVRRNLESAALVHASSEAERESVLAVAPAARTVVIPWGVDIPHAPAYRPPSDRRRQAAYIGRIIPLKGVDELLAAWDDARPPGWDLRFIGSDPEGHASRLRDAIDSRRLGETVSIQPAIDHASLLHLLHQLDLLILPSHSENFGLVAAEALAAGVPVITTTATPWQAVVHERCGWWVSDTTAGLAAAVREACGLPADDLAGMGARGRSWVAEFFAWPMIATRFANELYQACP